MDNKIRARRVRIFNFSTFDSFTSEEHALYNAINKCSNKDEKVILRTKFDNSVASFKGVRTIDNKSVYKVKEGSVTDEYREDKQIALFESEMIRWANDLSSDFPLVKEIIYFDIYHMDILKQILNSGIMIDGMKYIFYSSSANQQKKEMITLIGEEFYKKNESRIMCGLSVDLINTGNDRVKGCNPGKYLAYSSLPMSSSIQTSSINKDNTEQFMIDIDKCIVVDDFKTIVEEMVNFLDTETLKTEPMMKKVPVPHMDGAGIFLPGTLPSSGQIRGGFFKGCLFPFDFMRFIKEKNGKCIVKDVYGDYVDIVENDIQVLFTSSQLKMWKYYKNWDEYKKAFKENGCSILVNNLAHEPSPDAKVRLAYQFLQTLPRNKFTEDGMKNLYHNTLKYINGAKNDKEVMFQMMGILQDDEEELEPLQAALKLYPDMLYDHYVQEKMKDAVRAEQHRAMSGKPLVDGFYSYICPDLYAFCEWLFCDIEVPEGLIPKNQVYNSYYNDKEIEIVDCLRSPHLSDCEHGVRNLVKSDECKKWFIGTDTVVSTHDLLSKNLMNDVDGDECLITSSKELINLIDTDKLPLYYEMKSGKAVEINSNSIYEALQNSFENSIIGDISNGITKLWNFDGEPDLNFIRILTCYNNFMIDFPKTQYELPLKNYAEKYEKLKDVKTPYFFIHAKGKRERSCAPLNGSNVNRICKYVYDATRGKRYKLFDGAKKFNANYLMDNEYEAEKNRNSVEYKSLRSKIFELKIRSREIESKLSKAKIKLKRNDGFDEKHLKYDLLYHFCQDEILKIFSEDKKKAASYLVDIEYFQNENINNSKNILWNCFGDVLVENIQKNLKLEKPLKVRRNAYQKKKEKDNKAFMILQKEIADSISGNPIEIYKEEYDWIEDQQHKKPCKSDRLLLFILFYMHKAFSKNGKFRIYLNSKTKGITPNTINNWIGSDICKKGLKRLQDKQILSYEVIIGKYIEITMNFPEVQKSKKVYSIIGGNPLIPLYKYTKERKIKHCEICKRDYIVEGNSKTCSKFCSEKQQAATKSKHNTKEKAS